MLLFKWLQLKEIIVEDVNNFGVLILCIGGSGGRNCRKNWQNNMLAIPPEQLAPPWGNPGSATVLVLFTADTKTNLCTFWYYKLFITRRMHSIWMLHPPLHHTPIYTTPHPLWTDKCSLKHNLPHTTFPATNKFNPFISCMLSPLSKFL